jgi:hypothetical protein
MTATEAARERAVHRHARGADDELVADACAYAWLQLVRRVDVTPSPSGFQWLLLVAIQEAWRLQHQRPERPAGTLLAASADTEELDEPPGLAADPIDLVLAAELQRERIARFARLKPRERRDLLLSAGGYSYREIATLSRAAGCHRRVPSGRCVDDMSLKAGGASGAGPLAWVRRS